MTPIILRKFKKSGETFIVFPDQPSHEERGLYLALLLDDGFVSVDYNEMLLLTKSATETECAKLLTRLNRQDYQIVKNRKKAWRENAERQRKKIDWSTAENHPELELCEWYVQGCYSRKYGFETVCIEYTKREATTRLREYRENETQYTHRLVRVVIR